MTPLPWLVQEEDSPRFVCDVIDADELSFGVKGHFGLVVYIRRTEGVLPPLITNFVAGKARPTTRYVVFTPARLVVPAGRTYHVRVLAVLPPMSAMRPYLRSHLRPPSELASDVQPVILEGLEMLSRFRPREGQLIAEGAPVTEGDDGTVSSRRQRRKALEDFRGVLFNYLRNLDSAGQQRAYTLREAARRQAPEVAAKMLYEALRDEDEHVRSTAAYWLRTVANQIPLERFLGVLHDKGIMNAAEWEATAYVYTAHANEVPVEAVLDIYNGEYGFHSPLIHTIAVDAMGRLGERATDEVIALLANIVSEPRAMYDIRVRRQAAIALGEFGARAPVEALIACMQGGGQPEVCAAAARAIAQHPANIPDEIREEARLLSDDDTARRILYGRVLDRLRQQDLDKSKDNHRNQN